MTTVRVARPDDAPAILDLHVESIRAFGPATYDDRQVAAWAEKDGGPERYPVESDDHYLVVAEPSEADGPEGRIAAYGHLVPEACEVRAVYVRPEFAGRGVGTAVLDRLEARARELGLERLRLWSSLNAVGFYERAGYEAVDRTEIEKSLDGDPVEFPVVEMRRSLDD